MNTIIIQGCIHVHKTFITYNINQTKVQKVSLNARIKPLSHAALIPCKLHACTHTDRLYLIFNAQSTMAEVIYQGEKSQEVGLGEERRGEDRRGEFIKINI